MRRAGANWERSCNYRRKFLNATSPPYYCRYCHRRLEKEYMQVDHIVPVNAARNSMFARFILKRRGIYDINDLRNLCPSCSKCNHRKGAKVGLWTLRGFLGERLWFRAAYRVCVVAAWVALVAVFVIAYLQLFGYAG